MTGRCSRCDRLKATLEQWQADTCHECGAAWGDNPCSCSERVCWGSMDCVEIDWRARCLAAEDRLARYTARISELESQRDAMYREKCHWRTEYNRCTSEFAKVLEERDEARRERDVWRKLAESYETQIFAQGPTGSAPWGRPDGDPYEELKLLEKAGLVKPDGGNDDAT